MSEFRTALITSAVFHGIVGTVAYFGLPEIRRDFDPFVEAVPVEFISIDDVNRVTDPVPEIAPAVVEEAPAAIPAPAQPQQTAPTADAVPMPDAAPRERPAEPEPQIERRTIPQNIQVRSKPRPPSRLDAGRLAALIDRSVDQQQVQQPQTQEETPDPIEEAANRARLNAVQARIATATLESAIRQKVESCWTVPAGAKDAQDLLVRLKIFLRRDGTLARPPEFIDRARMSETNYRTAAESAARAVRQCAPYDLPADQYDLWRELNFTFDPKELLGG